MSTPTRIGAVVLTYNSTTDLPACLDGLLAQENIELYLIVVDNASAPEARLQMEADFVTRTNGVILDVTEATPTKIGTNHAIFIRNNRNAGYSAGNNIGARFAVELGCEAVLIINPDVRISDTDYISTLWEGMYADPLCVIASSKMMNLSGKDENPLREAEFWEELIWIRQYIPYMAKPKPYVLPPQGQLPIIADKVHGCCMLIRSTFLETIGYLDENVFLYCEEPILAKQARTHRARLVVFPKAKAVHAHVLSHKSRSSERMLTFIQSRLYYIRHYSDYSFLKKAALYISYFLLSLAHKIKLWFEKSL